MKFLVTRELGRLAKWLRILGFDTVYFKEENRSSLIIVALREDRIIITRNKKIYSAKNIRSLWIKSNFVKEQISEVMRELKLPLDEDNMFSRCTICNELISQIPKERVKDRVPEYVFKTQANFFTCPNCQRIYWQGTHWGNVQRCLKEIGIST
jgi:uncharacterized protein with PIN domain